jgi:hypothetical protein
MLSLLLSPIFQPAVEVSHDSVFQNETTIALNRLLEVQLALQAYHCDHQSYPSSFAPLTPIYIRQIPEDPFANHQPLRYRVKAHGYVLYSIGPDSVDDEGTPITSTASSEKYRLDWADRLKGDIVAGVNY